MKTAEVRALVHAAIGESRYPAALGDRVADRLRRPPQRVPRGAATAAALIAVVLIASLVAPRLAPAFPFGSTAAPAFSPNQVVGPVDANEKLPPADLDAVGLTADQEALVAHLNLTATSGGVAVKIIGAYADTARTVLFLRGAAGSMPGLVEIYDRTGLLNFGAGETATSAGDSVFELMGGPHPGAKGLAHLNVVVNGYASAPGPPNTAGTWKFSFDVPVQPARSLSLSPALTTLGPWKVRIEAMEVTPSAVRFQVLIDGASPSQVDPSMVHLVRPTGDDVMPSSSYSQLTNAMFFFIVIGTPQTRINVIWHRPPAGTYELRIAGHGTPYLGTVVIPSRQA